MKTFLGHPVCPSTRGILYLCNYEFGTHTIEVVREIQFADRADALNAFAEIPNPESQLVMGSTQEELEKELTSLHKLLNNPEWVKDLAQYI